MVGEKCSIALNTLQAGDANQGFINNIIVPWKNRFLCHLALSPLWSPRGVPDESTDVCGFVKPPETSVKRLFHSRQMRRFTDA